MLIEELLPQTNLETDDVEFKRIIKEGINPSDDKQRLEIGWLKEIAAFANSNGGKLIVGVENETHQVLSMDHEQVDKISLMVQRLVKEHIEPPIKYQISTMIVPNTKPIRYVLVISVEKSKYPPISLRFNGSSTIYIRHFGQTSAATGEEIRDLVMNSESVSFDDMLTSETYDPHVFSKLHAVFEKNNPGQKLTDKALISIGFMSLDKHLSRGALLFKDDCDDPRTLISITQFLGVSKGDDTYYYTNTIQKNLLEEYEIIKSFILSRTANGFVKQADNRIPLISYPERSLTEAIMNALGHRNYFITGGQIEINLYKDRLEIVSPGSLLGSRWLNVEKDLASIPPLRRNNVICAVFSLCKLMEEKGSGFDKISEEYKPFGDAYSPYASSNNQYFSLTLPDLAHAGGIVKVRELPRIHTINALEGKHDSFILSYCYNQERDANSIAKALGITPSTYFRKTTIERLVSQNYLLTRTEGKTTYYRVNPTTVFLDD